MFIKNLFQNHKSFFESFFSLSILNGINVLLPLFTLPYILRVIGAANYGIYSFVYIIINYILLITSYGFNFSVTKQISQCRDQHETINKIYNAVIASRLILFISGSIVFISLAVVLFESKIEFFMFLIGLGVVLGDIFVPTWLFQGMEKMRYITIVNVAAKLLFTILIFIVIRQPEDYVYIILLNSCGFILSGILSTFIAFRFFKLRFSLPKWKDVKFQFKEGWALFGSTMGINLYRESNIFILRFFVNDAAVGIYSAAEKIIKGLQLLTTPIAQALFPHLSNRFKNLSIKESLIHLKKISVPFSIILVLLTIATFLFAKILVQIIAGSGYNDAIILVRIMSPVIFFGGMNYLLGIVGLVNLNQQKKFFYFVLLTGIISVLFLLFSASYWGNIAASIAMGLSEFILFVCCFSSILILKKSNK